MSKKLKTARRSWMVDVCDFATNLKVDTQESGLRKKQMTLVFATWNFRSCAEQGAMERPLERSYTLRYTVEIGTCMAER